MSGSEPPAPSKKQERVHILDTVRGVTILSMCAFHTAYDLAYLYGLDMPWFTNGIFQEIWRVSISWTFLALAGWMTSLTRNNLKRGCIYALVAFLVWLATSVVSVDTPISFGIIFCMAASTLLWEPFKRLTRRIRARHPFLLAVLLVVLFLALYQVPRTRYSFSGFAWLGFPGPTFSSGDYYPLIPFSLLYLAFAVLADAWMRSKRPYPAWMMRDWAPPLTFMGRHSLFIYVIHQEVILGVLMLALGS